MPLSDALVDDDYESEPIPPSFNNVVRTEILDNSLQVMRLSTSPDLKLPKRCSDDAAGYDLFSPEDCVIEPKGKALIKTNLSIRVPDGCYGRIAPRSSLAWKHHIDVGAGVIDRDYRGDVGVILFNHSNVELRST